MRERSGIHLNTKKEKRISMRMGNKKTLKIGGQTTFDLEFSVIHHLKNFHTVKTQIKLTKKHDPKFEFVFLCLMNQQDIFFVAKLFFKRFDYLNQNLRNEKVCTWLFLRPGKRGCRSDCGSSQISKKIHIFLELDLKLSWTRTKPSNGRGRVRLNIIHREIVTKPSDELHPF